MRVGINAQLLSMSDTYRAAGVSNYIYNLLRNLSAMDGVDRYTIFTGQWARDERLRQNLNLGRNFTLRPSRFPTDRPVPRLIWEQTALAAASVGLDVLHGPVNVVPILSHVPRVVTIHDLAFLLFSDKHLPSKRRYLSLMTRLSARSASTVLTVSEATRADVLRLLNVPPEKVVAVPIAIDEEYRYLGNDAEFCAGVEEFKRKRGLPERYFLYLGTLEPRKNIPLMLRCYAEMRRQEAGRQSADSLPKLVIAGPKGWLYEQIFAQVKELNLEDSVIFPGFVPRDEIVWWYNAALAFVYLSVHEGFGLPVLQALACGVPAIVNNASALPEVAGDAALLISAEQPDTVTEAMRHLASSADLRESLREKGLERATHFSWRQTAVKTLEVYAQAAQRRK